jgi:hypothetical protein
MPRWAQQASISVSNASNDLNERERSRTEGARWTEKGLGRDAGVEREMCELRTPGVAVSVG